MRGTPNSAEESPPFISEGHTPIKSGLPVLQISVSNPLPLPCGFRLSFRHAAPEKTKEHDCRRRIAEPSAMGRTGAACERCRRASTCPSQNESQDKQRQSPPPCFKAPCPASKGFRGIAQGKLSTKCRVAAGQGSQAPQPLYSYLPEHPCLHDAMYMSRIPKSIRDIQTMEVATEEITYLVEEMARQHQEREPGEVDFYTAVAILAERYRDTQDHHRSFCVIERMRCLTDLLRDERGLDDTGHRGRLFADKPSHLPRGRQVSAQRQRQAGLVRCRCIFQYRAQRNGIRRQSVTRRY